MSSCRACPRSVVAAGTLIAAGTAFAGPPYFTDDPAPTDCGHWEIYQFVGGSHVAGSTAGEAGFDFNYGAARDVQVTFVVPAAYEKSGEFHAGFGVIETAVKYRFAHQSDAGWMPDVAFFPRIYWPTASSRFASTRASVLLPLWIGKDVGPWSVFGGGGYQINPGDGNRDFWLSGLAVTRAIGERWSVGGEIYHRTADATDGKALTALNVGLDWALSQHWSLLAALGPGVQNASQEMDYGFYVGLKSDY